MSALDRNSRQAVEIPTGPKAERAAWNEVAKRKPGPTKADWERDYTAAEWKNLDPSKRRAIEDARGQAMSRINVNQEFPTKQWKGMPRWMQEYVKAQRSEGRRGGKGARSSQPVVPEASKPEASSFEGSNYLKDPDAHSEVLTVDVETLERQSLQEAQGGRSETNSGTDLSDALKELSMGGDSSWQTQQPKGGDPVVLPASEMGGPSAPEGKRVPQRGCGVETSFISEGDMLGPEYSAKTVLGIRIGGSVNALHAEGKADRENITEIKVSMVDSEGNESVNTLSVAPYLPEPSGSAFTATGSSTK
jgi:hypothetical protein